MTFRQFAFNNVLRNKRLYAAYFLSSLFTVMVFFTFAIFAFHPAFREEGMNEKAFFAMAVAGGIIYVFSFFFVLYSMSSFLQSRKKEFGLLMMQGMSSRQIRLMVFLENMLIGFIATIGGILLGLVFAKAILLLAENVLIISESLDFYMPVMAIIVTFLSFIVLFLFISFFVSFILRTRKLIDLIKGDKKDKGEPKASVWLSLFAALLLIAGYATALWAKGVTVMMVMIPVIVLVVLGTYLLFSQLSVFIIRRLKRNEGIFWRKTNMVLFSDLSFRMKDNARSFFMVAIISTVAFSAIGALFGTYSYLTKGLVQANPYTYMYTPYEDTKHVEKNVQFAEKTIREAGIQTEKERIHEQYYPFAKNDEVLIIPISDYNRMARLLDKKELDLKGKEAVVGQKSIANISNDTRDEQLLDTPIKLKDGSTVKADSKIDPDALPNIEAYYIVSDAVYKQLPDPKRASDYYVWQAVKGQDDAVLKTGEKLQEHFQPGTFTSVDYILYMIDKGYGPILFIGLFIGIVFFVSAGSFLYFRLYSDLDEDKAKFRSIAKMGLTAGEMKRIVNRQTALLFFAPMIVALIHGAVALTALSHMFAYNLVTESVTVLGSFLVIQIVYFLFVRFFYVKQIERVIA